MKPTGTVRSVLLHLNKVEDANLTEVTELRPERSMSESLRNILDEEVKRLRRASK